MLLLAQYSAFPYRRITPRMKTGIYPGHRIPLIIQMELTDEIWLNFAAACCKDMAENNYD